MIDWLVDGNDLVMVQIYNSNVFGVAGRARILAGRARTFELLLGAHE